LLRLDDIQVLIVDDSADTREMMGLYLEMSGATPLAAGCASDALRALASARPHVLVCDISLPDENGIDLMRRIRSLSPEDGGTIPAIAVTGFASPQDRDEALSAGYQLHFAKPVEPERLVAGIVGLLGRHE
jgi:CheY-like chemotaxis protein